MRKIRLFCFSFLILCCFIFVWDSGVMAFDSYHSPVRVKIGSASSASVTVTAGTYQVKSGSGAVVSTLSAGGTASLTEGMILSSVDGGGRFSYGGTEYRGDLRIAGGDAVNCLGMEEYLYGVVMKELGGYAPDVDALKAQAIACRNYAYMKKESPRDADYDLSCTASDQAYGGYTGERYDTAAGRRVREAVDGTRDLVMYYDGSLVAAFYSANAGGSTENVENVWGGSYPYLKGISCPWDSYPFSGDAGTYVSMKMPTGSEWVYTISFADLTAKIPSVGTVTDVTVSHEGCVSDYARTVTVTGTAGSKTYTGTQFRSLLGLRSASFDVVVGKSVAANQALSTQYVSFDSFAAAFSASGKMLTIYGKGYGHGVGMSQWSACVMAYEGYTYDQILNYFYNQNQTNGRLVIRQYQ
ncbi:MAG: SpoIID/LytB domain-containing protein [Clostridia bacterium]